jgi:hypothetical protein
MKTTNFIVITLHLLLILSSCKKNENNNGVYTELLPNIKISSIDSHQIDSITGKEIPSPENGDTSVYIDIDKDREDDFKVCMFHRINRSYLEEGAPEWVYFYYYVYIKGLNGNQYIAKGTDNAGNCGKVIYMYDEYESIKDSIWADSLNINSHHGIMECDFPSNFTGETYIGLKIENNTKKYFGWIHVEYEYKSLTILEYAIYLANNKKVYAGEYE